MVSLRKRDAAIRRSKAPARELAEKHGISASRVWEIRNPERAAKLHAASKKRTAKRS